MAREVRGGRMGTYVSRTVHARTTVRVTREGWVNTDERTIEERRENYERADAETREQRGATALHVPA